MVALQKPALAYVVTEDCESTGGIVFATSNVAARRIGSQTFGDGEFSGWSCRRAPFYDSYAPGPVPEQVMFENGWWWECANDACRNIARADDGGTWGPDGALCSECSTPDDERRGTEGRSPDCEASPNPQPDGERT